MKNILILLFVFFSLVSCNVDRKQEIKNSVTQEQLQGAWYTDTLVVNGKSLDTHDSPEKMMAFVFQENKVRAKSMVMEVDGTYHIKNDSIDIIDFMTNEHGLTMKVNSVSPNRLDLIVCDGQNVRLIMKRFKDKKQ